ncbi:hypothetical protein N7481_005759 [Penicillium waksmanii]|uniref:uncharacterized protein n=1 Tax=Penicillium waksmanii TaxID=69791 RepID=UPI002547FE34|nr:uncharacterized protein N7481_005759 [Penicillium waksmanii]KAJ5983660.1 hypothetical protein N7481_005759 [Penicillium waksmanii]
MAGSPNSNLRAFNHAVHTLLKHPAQFLPHLTIPTFTYLPEELGPHLTKITRSVPPKTTNFPPQILSKLAALRQSPTSPFRHPNSILIVSNRAGSHPKYDHEISSLESQLAHLSIPVFRLPAGVEKKPFCGDEVVQWLREREVVDSPDQIAVVGDRLGTDVVMAGLMGSWSVWCKEGVFEPGEVGKPERNILEKMEVWVEKYLRGKGYKAPMPRDWEKV